MSKRMHLENHDGATLVSAWQEPNEKFWDRLAEAHLGYKFDQLSAATRISDARLQKILQKPDIQFKPCEVQKINDALRQIFSAQPVFS